MKQLLNSWRRPRDVLTRNDDRCGDFGLWTTGVVAAEVVLILSTHIRIGVIPYYQRFSNFFVR